MIVIKIVLWILLAILIIVFLALFVPVYVTVKYTDDIYVYIKFLFLKINVAGDKKTPKKKKKPKKIKASKTKSVSNKKVTASKKTKNTEVSKGKKQIWNRKKEKPPKKQENAVVKWIKKTFHKKGLSGLLNAFKEIAKLTGTFLKPVFEHITIKKLDVNVTVASDNAADTAVNYGYFCAGMYPAIEVILQVMKYDDYSVIIVPDFDKKNPEFDVTAVLFLVPWFVVVGAVKAFGKFLVLKRKGKL